MSVSGIGNRSLAVVQALVDMRSQLDDLQRQLGTGKKSNTYAGLGLERGLTVGLRSQLSAIDGYSSTITSVGVRLNLAQTTLARLDDLGHAAKSAIQTSSFVPDSSGQTTEQRSALDQLGEMLELLNTQVGDRYIYSGKAVTQPAVETLDHIMNGDGTRAGLKQIIAERREADLGTSGLGRVVVSAPTATSVSVAEDAAGSPFGLKLAGVSSSLTGATVTGPAGSPAAIGIDLGATNPNAGDTITYTFTLPDGTSDSVTLTATTSTTPGPNEFTIGATSDVTAANLQAALTAGVSKIAGTSLTAASAVAASNDFFSIDAANPPRRVAGPPFDTATALTSGTPSNTVSWYTGEAGSDPARSTSTARVDQSITVSYGMRANEEGIRWVAQNIAVFAATSFSSSDPNAEAQYDALKSRVGSALDVPAGTQRIQDIEGDIAGAQTTLSAATDRHQQVKTTLNGLLQSVEGVPTEEVAAQILALQTRLQASLQTTAMLYQTSLVNYL